MALGVSGHRLNIVLPLKEFRIGSWRIKAFPVIHNAAEPLGFLLVSGSEKLIFATDTAFIPSRFQGITYLMVEANYQETILRENVALGTVSITLKNQLLSAHMSLETLRKWLEAQDLSKLKETWLLHASDQNSDVFHMQEVATKITGKPVHIAEKRMTQRS